MAEDINRLKLILVEKKKTSKWLADELGVNPSSVSKCKPSVNPAIRGLLMAYDLEGVNWIIVGGESGPIARPMKEEWVLNIKQQAEKNAIPFFFKQWGTWSKDGIKGNKKNGKLLRGEVIQQMPKVVHENFSNKDQTKFWE